MNRHCVSASGSAAHRFGKRNWNWHSIEGMHCENCKNTVEKYINQIDGASAQVNLKKNIAVVQLDRPVDDTDLRTAVARAGFTVAGIEQMEA